MKINDNNPAHNTSKRSNYFVLVGPLIATVLTVLYGHLIGFLSTDQFGQNIGFRDIEVMIILFFPMTIGAYVVGFIPAWITGRFFHDLINRKMLLKINTTTRIVLISGLVGAPWSMIAIVTNNYTWWYFLAVGGVTVPTSILCAWIDLRHHGKNNDQKGQHRNPL